MRSISLAAIVLLGLNGAAFSADLVSNANFVVLAPRSSTGSTAQPLAKQVLAQAEKYRGQIAREWLGQRLPPSVGRTVINVSLSDDQQSAHTWTKDHPNRNFHNIYLTATPELLGQTVENVLAHEIAHIVLATEYPHPHRLPAWVEEGIASRYDDQTRKDTRREIIRWYARTGNWMQLNRVLSAANIDAKDQAAYAVSASLTDYLIRQADKPTFVRFAADGRRGWNQALQKHYRIENVDELQRRWRRWAAEPKLAVANRGVASGE